MIPEYAYQIIIGFLFVGFTFAVTYILLSRKSVPDIIVGADDFGTDWQHITQKLPLGNTSQSAADAAVSTAFRESLIMQADDRKIIFDLRAMLVDKNATIVLRDGQIHIQSDLLRESAVTLEWKDKLILLQENRIRVFEKHEASRLFDDYRERKDSIAEDEKGSEL